MNDLPLAPIARSVLGAGLALLVIGCTQGRAARFDGERAFADLVAQVELGPRPMGSRGAAEVRALISERLADAGWSVKEEPFEARVPDGRVLAGVNLRALRPGRSAKRLWLAAHYDTKDLTPRNFVGANDGASGVAVLLELARVLGPRPGPVPIELVFFDGEEAVGPNIDEDDGLYGSRALARELARSGELASIGAFVLLDMVGDADLNLTPDRSSTPWLLALFRRLAEARDPGLWDEGASVLLVDDHTPFREAGVRDVIALIDFQYGGRRTPGSRWHTPDDDLSGVSAKSLNRVGGLVVQALEEIERRLIAR